MCNLKQIIRSRYLAAMTADIAKRETIRHQTLPDEKAQNY